MKIGLFTDTFYPEINGVATSCLNLQRELTRRGHEVHVYAPKCKGWEENQRENVHYLASAPLLVLKDRNFAFPTPLTSWEAEKIDFDVVHTNSEFVMGMFGHHVAGSLGCAQVHTYHTVWEDYTYYITHGVADEAARRIARKYSQWWCNRFDRVITPTGKTLDLLRKYGVAAPIDIIPSGMDIARFDPARHGEQERLETRRECGLPEHAPLLLNIGRIAKEKNLEQVMRVFPRLLNACPDVHFAVVGEGPMREELGRMAEELGVSRAVTLTGPKPWEKIDRYYAMGDVFCSASHSETQGLTYVEAMASGLCVCAVNDPCLDGVVEDCVNAVGVDINTASPSLLQRVAGLNGTTAKNVVSYREENGAFTSRAQIKKVPKLGPKAFQQCAGFLRVPESRSVLDNTAVHPESYEAAKALLDLTGHTLADVKGGRLADLPDRVKAYGEDKAAGEIGVGVPTLRDIVSELLKPGRDVRDELPKPILRTDVLEMKDLKPGMVLTGTVRNVIDFGVFVDIGVHQDGLVHISQVSNKFIKHPSEVVSVGDVVKVVVLEVDEKKKRISLSMKQAK